MKKKSFVSTIFPGLIFFTFMVAGAVIIYAGSEDGQVSGSSYVKPTEHIETNDEASDLMIWESLSHHLLVSSY